VKAMRRYFFAALVVATLSVVHAAAEEALGPARVKDADTLELAGKTFACTASMLRSSISHATVVGTRSIHAACLRLRSSPSSSRAVTSAAKISGPILSTLSAGLAAARSTASTSTIG